MAFPQVGLEVILEVKQFQGQFNRLQKMLTDVTKGLQKVGIDITKAFVNPQTRQALVTATADVQKFTQSAVTAWRDYIGVLRDSSATEAEKTRYFDMVIRHMQNLDVAEDKLATTSHAATAEIAASMASLAVTVAVVTAAFTVFFSIVKNAVNTFNEFVGSIRSLAAAMGVTMEEASAWAKMARDVGVSTDVMARGAAAFERQVESLKLAQLEGIEVNNNFSRALSYLSVDIEAAGGGYKTATELYREATEKLQGLGSQAERTGLAYMLMGRQNRASAEIMRGTLRTFEETEKAAERLGVAMGPKQEEALLQYRQALSDAKDGTKGFSIMLGQNFIKAATAALQAFAELTITARRWFATLSASMIVFNELIRGQTKLSEAVERHEAIVRDMMNVQTEEDRIAAERAKKEEAAASRMMDYLEAEAHYMENRAKAHKQMLEQMEDAERNYQQQLEDLGRREERDAIERALRLAWELEDIQRRTTQRYADLQKSLTRRLADIDRDRRERVEDLQKDYQRRIEDLEREHQRRLLAIQLDYQDAVAEAVRSNDAVAILRAMRTRARAIRDEELRLSQQREDEQRNLEERRQDQVDDYEKRKADAQRQYQEQLEDLREQLLLEENERIIARDREKILRDLHHKWTFEDMQIAYDRQREEIRRNYEKELTDQKAHLEELRVAAYNATFSIGKAVAEAIRTGGDLVLTAQEQWLSRHAFMMAENIKAMYAIASTAGLSEKQQWLARHKYLRATGGVDVVNKPTTFMAGEAGPEIAAFIPLRQSMTVNHRFGNLPVQLGGQSIGNMGRSQMEALVWEALDYIGERLG